MDKTNNNTPEKELSEIRVLRDAIQRHYITTAWDVFAKFVECNESELTEFRRVTHDATIVFTRPSEETLRTDKESENPRFTKGRAFGSVQWYKKTQVVGTALAIATSYASYLAYTESKENQIERDEKKLAAAAAVLGVTVEQLKALQTK